jgi:hypothetical protein
VPAARSAARATTRSSSGRCDTFSAWEPRVTLELKRSYRGRGVTRRWRQRLRRANRNARRTDTSISYSSCVLNENQLRCVSVTAPIRHQ